MKGILPIFLIISMLTGITIGGFTIQSLTPNYSIYYPRLTSQNLCTEKSLDKHKDAKSSNHLRILKIPLNKRVKLTVTRHIPKKDAKLFRQLLRKNRIKARNYMRGVMKTIYSRKFRVKITSDQENRVVILQPNEARKNVVVTSKKGAVIVGIEIYQKKKWQIISKLGVRVLKMRGEFYARSVFTSKGCKVSYIKP